MTTKTLENHGFFVETAFMALLPPFFVGSMYALFRIMIAFNPCPRIFGVYTRAWADYFTQTATIIVLYFLHPTLVWRTFATASCLHLGSRNTDWFMAEDLTIRCWGQEHYRYLFGLGLPMLLLYVIGAPLFVFSFLSAKRDLIKETRGEVDFKFESEKHQMNAFEGKYGLMYGGYHKDFFWWEVLVLGRKSILCGVCALFKVQEQSQGLFAILGVGMHIFAHIRTTFAVNLLTCF
jgi:hypothetical protein